MCQAPTREACKNEINGGIYESVLLKKVHQPTYEVSHYIAVHYKSVFLQAKTVYDK